MTNSFYINRISKVIDYIENNIDGKLRLNDLAEVAMFSKYHFHRIFKSVTGDNLNDFIKRLKMIKAHRLLQIDKSITVKDLAYSLGYNSVANFSRDFREYYGITPTEIKSLKDHSPGAEIKTDTKKINVTFEGTEKIPGSFVIYQKITTGYSTELIPKLFDDLYKLALEKGFPIRQFIGIGYDDPEFSPADKCKYDACIVVDKELLPRDIPYNTKMIKGGLFAVFHFEGYKDSISLAWDYIFKEWLLNSDYMPDDRPHLEIYLYSEQYEKGIFNVNLCLPVKSINK